MMCVTQKQQRAVETGSMARTAIQRGPGLRGDLRHPRVPGRGGAGRGGTGAAFSRPPPEGSRGARRRPAGPQVSLAPGGPPLFRGPVWERRGVCVSRWRGPWGTTGARGAAPERQAGRGSCGARARGACRARAALLPTLPPSCLARSPGLVSSGSGQCLGPGPGPARSPERLVLGDLATACLGPRGSRRRPRSWVGGGAGRVGAAELRGVSEWAVEGGGGRQAALGLALRASASTSAVFTERLRGAHVGGRGPGVAGTYRPSGEDGHHPSALGLAFGEGPTLIIGSVGTRVGLGPGHWRFHPGLGSQEWESDGIRCPRGRDGGSCHWPDKIPHPAHLSA